MKKLIMLLIVALSFTSCIVAKISDEPIIVKSQHKLPKEFRFKYFYKCKQEGVKVRVYSNDEYKPGQSIKNH